MCIHNRALQIQKCWQNAFTTGSYASSVHEDIVRARRQHLLHRCRHRTTNQTDEVDDSSPTPCHNQQHSLLLHGPIKKGKTGKFFQNPQCFGSPPSLKEYICYTFDSRNDHLNWAYISRQVILWQCFKKSFQEIWLFLEWCKKSSISEQVLP